MGNGLSPTRVGLVVTVQKVDKTGWICYIHLTLTISYLTQVWR